MAKKITNNNSNNNSGEILPPFRSLFLSTTRPIPESSSTSRIPPHFILFQYSNSLVPRLLAAEPSSNSAPLHTNTDTTTEKDSHTPTHPTNHVLTPKIIHQRNLSSRLWIQQAFCECLYRCDGRVIFIQCSPSSCSLLSSLQQNSSSLWQKFLKFGALIDLHSDPLGWDEDTIGGQQEPTILQGNISNLNSIISYVHIASKHLVAKNDSCDTTKNKFTLQPIPILFDSLVPLIHIHGIEGVHMLLQHLKMLNNNHYNNNDTSSIEPKNKSIHFSPIFLPIMKDILSPNYNRILEDSCDSTLTLSNGLLHIVKRSSRSGMVSSTLGPACVRLMKDVQYFQLDNGWSERTENEDGFCGVDGLVLLTSNRIHDVSNSEHTPPNNESTSSYKTSGSTKKSVSNTNNNYNEVPNNKIRGPISSSKRINLRHEQDEQPRTQPTVSNNRVVNKPNIYLENNDPEFHDFDEEDPDDDLDI